MKNNIYEQEVISKWGNTKEYKEYSKKEINESIHKEFMNIFKAISLFKDKEVSDVEVQQLILKLHNYISTNYYNCSKEVFNSLGKMYIEDERFKNNIDDFAGKGTAEYVSQAIEYYCSK